MVGTEIRGRLIWRVATVVETLQENPTTRSIGFNVPGWPGHLAGQHLDIRLTAEDGYQALRSYSIAAPTMDERVTITVELVSDGEVSPFLIDEVEIGDHIELRGPIGGYFVWDSASHQPLLLIGGGSGVVPLMAMLRAHHTTGSITPAHYLASARSADRLIYFDEVTEISTSDPNVSSAHTLTRSHPDSWDGPTRRIDTEMLSIPGFLPVDGPEIFVCGPTGFVEAVSQSLIEIGHPPTVVRTERFGPSGG